MSILFGRWNYDGKAVDPEYIGKVRTMLDAQSPDGVTICLKSTFVILYGALHVTEESRREHQPAISPSGIFLTWDGRLDNRAELLSGRRWDWNYRQWFEEIGRKIPEAKLVDSSGGGWGIAVGRWNCIAYEKCGYPLQ